VRGIANPGSSFTTGRLTGAVASVEAKVGKAVKKRVLSETTWEVNVRLLDNIVQDSSASLAISLPSGAGGRIT
jgi:hypothetical protein